MPVGPRLACQAKISDFSMRRLIAFVLVIGGGLAWMVRRAQSSPMLWRRSRMPAASFGMTGSGASGSLLCREHSLFAAIADFSIAYADQSERDHDVLVKAVRAGKLEVFIEGE